MFDGKLAAVLFSHCLFIMCSERLLSCSSSRHGATKLKPLNSSCAVALGGTPGESVDKYLMNSTGDYCMYYMYMRQCIIFIVK